MPETAASSSSEQRNVIVLPRQRDPPRFSAGQDPEDWLAAYERICTFNCWDDSFKLANVPFFLSGPAETWFTNHEDSFDGWDAFKTAFKEAFAIPRKEEASRLLLQRRYQRQDERVLDFFEDIVRLCRRVDPDMPDTAKLEHLMRGVRDEFFTALISSPPSSAAEFLTSCQRIERSLEQRRSPTFVSAGSPPSPPIGSNIASIDDLRRLIREVIREELGSLTVDPPRDPDLRTLIREEVQAIQGGTVAAVHYQQPQNQAPRPSWSQVASAPRRQPSPRRPQAPRPSTQARRTDIWRTEGGIPLCFACGRPGHVRRYCRVARPQPTQQRRPRPSYQFDASHRRPYDATSYDDAFPPLPRSSSDRSRSRSPSPGQVPRRSSSPHPGRHRSPSPAVTSRYTRPTN